MRNTRDTQDLDRRESGRGIDQACESLPVDINDFATLIGQWMGNVLNANPGRVLSQRGNSGQRLLRERLGLRVERSYGAESGVGTANTIGSTVRSASGTLGMLTPPLLAVRGACGLWRSLPVRNDWRILAQLTHHETGVVFVYEENKELVRLIRLDGPVSHCSLCNVVRAPACEVRPDPSWRVQRVARVSAHSD